MLARIRDSPFARVSHRQLVARCWELRENLTAYDATYVALAVRLRVPLLTCDARPGRAPGHDAEVLVYSRS